MVLKGPNSDLSCLFLKLFKELFEDNKQNFYVGDFNTFDAAKGVGGKVLLKKAPV